MAAKTQPTERQSAGATAGADHILQKFDERWRALNDLQRTHDRVEDLHSSDDKLNEQFKNFRGASPQPKPGEDLDNLIPRVSRLDDKASDRARAMESRTKGDLHEGLHASWLRFA